MPHSSTCIPVEVRAQLLVDDAELSRELIRLTDWHTDRLYGWTADLGAAQFINGLSRLVIDPERFVDDAAELVERAHSSGSTKTSISPPHGRPTSIAMSSVMP